MDFNDYTFDMLNVDKINTTIHVYRVFLNDFEKIKPLIDKELVDIYYGDSFYDLTNAKSDLTRFILNAEDKNRRCGIVAEFFLHLFLRKLGYTQECIFSNLEDNSMKKGFDGFYVYNNEFWIAESKSAHTQCIHKDKIYEALTDIEQKVSNTSKNNPWKNAIHHINSLDDSKKDLNIINKVKILSKDFIKKTGHSSSEFNLIPVSTLFVKNGQSDDEIFSEIKAMILGKKIKKAIIVCVDNDIYDAFLNYIKE